MDDIVDLAFRYLVPSFAKSNEWLYSEALYDIRIQERHLERFDRRERYKEEVAERELMIEMRRSKNSVADAAVVTNMDMIIAKYKMLKSVRKTREHYMNCAVKLQEHKRSLAEFYGFTIQNDTQTSMNHAVTSMGLFVTTANVNADIKNTQEVKARFKGIQQMIEQANKVGSLTPEEEKRYEEECLSGVHKIAEELGQHDLVTGLNQQRNKNGQFTSAHDIDSILPRVNVKN